MIKINDIVHFKTPMNPNNWGKVKWIIEIKDSEYEEEKNKIIYRVIPLENTVRPIDVEISDIYESYRKQFSSLDIKV